MKLSPLAIAALATGGFLLMTSQGKSAPSSLVRGKAYRALFELPEALAVSPEVDRQLKTVMPPGSDIVMDGRRVQVKFVAPQSSAIGDVPTPLGAIRLVSLEELG